MSSTVILALAILAGILAGIELVRSRGVDLLAWAVLALAIAEAGARI